MPLCAKDPIHKDVVRACVWLHTLRICERDFKHTDAIYLSNSRSVFNYKSDADDLNADERKIVCIRVPKST